MNRYPTSDSRAYKKAKLHTGEIVTGLSRAHLRKHVFERLEELNALPPNLDSYFANAICDALPADRAARECRIVGTDAPASLQVERVLRADDVWRFIRAMKNWVSAGGGTEAQGEAERRAQICAQCPKNVDVAGCAWCSGMLSAALELLSGRSTHFDGLLRHCEVCGCNNRVAVHFPMSAVDATLDYPEWCWKKQ